MDNKIKSEQLGIPFGTASNRLRKSILFKLIVKCNENICYRCGKEILTEEELSIEHKIPWLHSENPKKLFFDTENITFSHLDCNISSRRPNIQIWGKSKYKGVYLDKVRNKWVASYSKKNKNERIHKQIGRFNTEEEAYRAYQEYIKKRE